ncbi:acetate/propionate family kinase [Xylocopilactobacillus apicola]|uniref:Acetate kinase n=1 Tax=Xylocopilactobacillus apicola TaxID=2932184 RepID=A0AAU9D465_9LACO|nr:acetate kinase [Xylocopilactobacillus apicola]BDR58569.1 acetate kinase [Xylocopilactobacillus apicola]
MVKIIAINCGSSTLKFKLFEMPEETVIASGMVDRLGLSGSTFELKSNDGKKIEFQKDVKDHNEAVTLLLKNLVDSKIIDSLDELGGVGHRVVAGGETYEKSTLVDQHVINNIKYLSIYAPLHNYSEARGMEAFVQANPKLPQVAVFDTALYSQMPEVNYLYSIPIEYYKNYGARKYGAHGTSHRYITGRAAEMLNQKLEDLNIISLHLGSGASITATEHGKVIDTSMGFTPMAGITMSTRSGDIDPSLVLFLMSQLKISDPNEMADILNQKSGLLGLSGISPDMRDLQKVEDTNQRARLALDIFVNRIVKYVGSYVAEMGSVDVITFSAGIGENDAEIRENIINQLSFINAKIDLEKNDVRGEEIDLTGEGSAVKVLLITTDEELMIARDAYEIGYLNKE